MRRFVAAPNYLGYRTLMERTFSSVIPLFSTNVTLKNKQNVNFTVLMFELIPPNYISIIPDRWLYNKTRLSSISFFPKISLPRHFFWISFAPSLSMKSTCFMMNVFAA